LDLAGQVEAGLDDVTGSVHGASEQRIQSAPNSGERRAASVKVDAFPQVNGLLITASPAYLALAAARTRWRMRST